MMNCFLTKPINIPVSVDVHNVLPRIARLVGAKPAEIASARLFKQSIDARDKRDVRFVCSYLVETRRATLKNATPYVAPQDLLASPVPHATGSCIVVGSGPGGLFLARYLTLCGVKVTVVERGSDVPARQQAVKAFFDGGELDENCNVQFGLGGAGTFSDGKLTTGISSPLTHTVFNEFVRCGAPQEILTAALPHIGTDNLVYVVAKLRDEIQQHGGRFLFDTCVTDLVVRDGRVVGVEATSVGTSKQLLADTVALCCGHSAREIFQICHNHGVEMAVKPFAVGLRIEHPRQFVNTAQYGELFATHRDLGAATYKLVHNMDARSCYSFCMCPGGVVVAASSLRNTVVVNGMSNFARDAANSNSALVVTVGPADLANWGYGSDVFAGVNFQQHLEEAAYRLGGGNYLAPCQNVTDFLADRKSDTLQLAPSYPRGTTPANLRDILPQEIGDAIAEALAVFNRKIKGFAECGVLTGVETRTSSPVKLLRDKETLQSNITGLFPVGEGAGHAGGIVSSAVDGLKVAQAIVQFLGGNISTK